MGKEEVVEAWSQSLVAVVGGSLVGHRWSPLQEEAEVEEGGPLQVEVEGNLSAVEKEGPVWRNSWQPGEVVEEERLRLEVVVVVGASQMMLVVVEVVVGEVGSFQSPWIVVHSEWWERDRSLDSVIWLLRSGMVSTGWSWMACSGSSRRCRPPPSSLQL